MRGECLTLSVMNFASSILDWTFSFVTNAMKMPRRSSVCWTLKMQTALVFSWKNSSSKPPQLLSCVLHSRIRIEYKPRAAGIPGSTISSDSGCSFLLEPIERRIVQGLFIFTRTDRTEDCPMALAECILQSHTEEAFELLLSYSFLPVVLQLTLPRCSNLPCSPMMLVSWALLKRRISPISFRQSCYHLLSSLLMLVEEHSTHPS